MIPEEARALFQYNDWANQRSLDATAQLSNEQFVKPLGSSFSSVRDTLMHVCGAEWIWFERFHGRSHSGIPDFSNIQTIGALREHWAPQAKALLDFVHGLSQAELDRVFEYKTLNFGGTARGPSFAGPPREAGMLSRVRFPFCESETIRSKGRLRKISARI